MSKFYDTSCFPLPLAPFESYMLGDDRPAHPMTFTLHVGLTGEVQRAPWEAALAEVLGHHPILRALVQKHARGVAWVAAGDVAPAVHWGFEGEPLLFPQGETISLERETGLRMWIRQGLNRAEVTLQFHHSCCDGMASESFLVDLLAAYGRRVDVNLHDAHAHPRNATLLAARGCFDATPPSALTKLRRFGHLAREAALLELRRPNPLASPRDISQTNRAIASEAKQFPPLEWIVLDEAALAAMRVVAARHQVTLNDLFLRDLFLTLQRWNARHATGNSRNWLRISMPANLRLPRDEHLPAANRVTMSFLTRREELCGDPHQLLLSLRKETHLIRSTRRGMRFIEGLGLLGKMPGGMAKMTSDRRCRATAVLSNLGDCTARIIARLPVVAGRITAGNLQLDHVMLVPPVRPHTCAAIGVSTHYGQTYFALRCDPTWPAQSSQELLQLYQSALQDTAASASEAAPAVAVTT